MSLGVGSLGFGVLGFELGVRGFELREGFLLFLACILLISNCLEFFFVGRFIFLKITPHTWFRNF
jgi:hypothetical protein